MDIKDYVILEGHVLHTLKQIPDEFVQCVVTSPPYFGARNYGTEWQLWGGDNDCHHEWMKTPPRRQRDPKDVKNPETIQNSNKGANCALPETKTCLKCGGWFGELGLEPTANLFVKHLCSIFNEVRRVLRKDGVCWVNIGDSYSSGNRKTQVPPTIKEKLETFKVRPPILSDVKEKELIGIPWRFAFAMQDAGWYIRSEICWAKTNCQPESVKDRPTRSWEYVFMFTKSAHYYYDQDAIREPHSEVSLERIKHPFHLNDNVDGRAINSPYNGDMSRFCHPLGANKRNVWIMPASEGINIDDSHHYASFPKELPTTCIKASTKPGNIVLDPFSGSGTTGLVALQLGRCYIGCELLPEYIELSKKRIEGKEPLFQIMREMH